MGSEEETPPPPPEATDDAEPAVAPAKEKPGMKVALLAIGAVAFLGLSVWAVTFAVKLLMTPSPVVEEQAETPAEPNAEPTDVAEVPVVVGDEPEPATPVTPEPVVVAPPPTMENEPVIWPVLVLNGLVGEGAQGSILVNNQIIDVGDTIEDVRVVSISKHGAMLEYEGEKKFVKVNGSTE